MNIIYFLFFWAIVTAFLGSMIICHIISWEKEAKKEKEFKEYLSRIWENANK